MRTLGSVWLGAACIALLLTPSAQAHKLTVKRAEAFLSPIAASMAPQVAPKIAAKLPGATISKTSAECQVFRVERHGADCTLNFLVAGVSTGETGCFVIASVSFRNSRSRKLKYSLGEGLSEDPPQIFCLFTVPL